MSARKPLSPLPCAAALLRDSVAPGGSDLGRVWQRDSVLSSGQSRNLSQGLGSIHPQPFTAQSRGQQWSTKCEASSRLPRCLVTAWWNREGDDRPFTTVFEPPEWKGCAAVVFLMHEWAGAGEQLNNPRGTGERGGAGAESV